MKQQQTLQPKLRFPEFDGDWDYKPLGEFVSNKSKKFNPKNNEDNLKCVELEHIDQNTGRLLGFISSLDTNSTKNVFKKGEVLYGKLRPYLNKYYYCEFDGVCSSEIWVLSGNNFSNKLISQLTQTNYFKFVTLKTTGSKMPRADWNVLSETEFCVPLDIPEQQKIADYLSTIDTKINLLEEKKAQLGLYKKAMMQKLFSQEIRFKPSEAEALEAYPEWEEKRLGDFIIVKVGATPSTSKKEYWDGNIGWINSGELKDGKIYKPSKYITELGLKNSSTFLLPKGTVVLAMTGATLGKLGILMMDSTANQSVAGFVPNSSFINEYLFYYLMNFQNKIFEKAGGAAQIGINKFNIESLKIDIPSLPEQQKIAEFLSAIDESIEKVTEQMSQTQSFKKAMLQGMFV